MKTVVFEPVEQAGKELITIRFATDKEQDNSIKRFEGIK